MALTALAHHFKATVFGHLQHRLEQIKNLAPIFDHDSGLCDKVRAAALTLFGQRMLNNHAGIEKVERRELAAFMRDQRTDQRVRDRGGDDTLPSLTTVLDVGREAEAPAPYLLSSFA